MESHGDLAAQEEGTMGVPGSAYRLLLSCPSGLSRSQVHVDFSAHYDRIPHPDGCLEKSIAEIWSQRMQSNTTLYNGQKFRYGGCTLNRMGNLSTVDSLCLKLGLTDYRTFVGTNLNPLWKNFLAPFEDDSRWCQHMASPLGNGAIIRTFDKKLLVLQRSASVGEFPGYFVFPGGHSEPKEVGISAHMTDKASSVFSLINQKVAEEMFDGITREVVEEIGVPASSLTDPLFIGISLRELNVRPTAFFFLKCNLKSEDVHKLYANAQDGYESTQLYAMSESEIEDVTLKIPGCHRGGYALYKLMAGSGAEV